MARVDVGPPRGSVSRGRPAAVVTGWCRDPPGLTPGPLRRDAPGRIEPATQVTSSAPPAPVATAPACAPRRQTRVSGPTREEARHAWPDSAEQAKTMHRRCRIGALLAATGVARRSGSPRLRAPSRRSPARTPTSGTPRVRRPVRPDDGRGQPEDLVDARGDRTRRGRPRAGRVALGERPVACDGAPLGIGDGTFRLVARDREREPARRTFVVTARRPSFASPRRPRDGRWSRGSPRRRRIRATERSAAQALSSLARRSTRPAWGPRPSG